MRRRMIGLAALVVVGLVSVAIYRQTRPSVSVVAPISPLEANAIALDVGVDSVAAEGRIVPWGRDELAFLHGGAVAELLVAEGAQVQAGEPLVRLVATDEELAYQQAQAALTQAEATIEAAEAALAQAQTGLEAARLVAEVATLQLATLTTDPTDAQLAVQEAQLAVAGAAVQQAQGQRGLALEAATTAKVRAAQAELQVAEAELLAPRNRLDQLQRDGAASDQIEQAQLAYNAAVAQAQAAQAVLDELQAGATTAERQTAEAAVSAAVANRAAAQANFDLFVAGTRAEQIRLEQINLDRAEQAVALAELAVQQAEIALTTAQNGREEAVAVAELAQTTLEQMTLTAPFAGTVAQINTKVGQQITPSTPLVVLADLRGWRVETTDLSELNVVAVAVGHPVQVTVDAFPREPVTGVVSDIAAVSDVVLGDVTYTVTIDLAETALPLRWGMTAFVDVETQRPQ